MWQEGWRGFHRVVKGRRVQLRMGNGTSVLGRSSAVAGETNSSLICLQAGRSP
jgi:hypothetical protein